MALIEHYLNKDGKIKVWPSKQEAKLAVVIHLGKQFEPERYYTEKEVNGIIERNHTFGDYFLLRRELVDRGILERKADGSQYWKSAFHSVSGPASIPAKKDNSIENEGIAYEESR